MKTFNDIIVGIKKWAKAKEIKRGVYMDLRVLRYFLTVAKEQSFTKAAKQLHITQPTLSRQLAALEAELGVTLFDRGGHGITLTNEGILLKRRALEMVDLEDKIASEFKGSDGIVEGTITVGCGNLWLWRSLPGYARSIKKSILWSVLPCIQVPQILFLK